MKTVTTKGLFETSGNPITNMNADWDSAPMPMGDFRHVGIQLGWDNSAVQGILKLQYTCDTQGDGSDIEQWSDKNLVSIDGTFSELLFLDGNLPVANYRLVFIHTSGTANLLVNTVRKD